MGPSRPPTNGASSFLFGSGSCLWGSFTLFMVSRFTSTGQSHGLPIVNEIAGDSKWIRLIRDAIGWCGNWSVRICAYSMWPSR